MAAIYWYDHEGNGDFDDVAGNFNANVGGDGAHVAPAADSVLLFDDHYSGNACNVDADATVAAMQMAVTTYTGVFTIENAVTLTDSGYLETGVGSTWIVTGALVVGAGIEIRGAMTGAGPITVGGELRWTASSEWSTYSGTLTWNGAGDVLLMPESATCPGLVVDGTGSLTVGYAGGKIGQLTMTAGTFGLGTYTLTVDGLTGTGGTVNLGTGTLVTSGTVDFNGITVTAGDLAWITGGGTVQGLTLSAGVVMAAGCVDGGGNSANVLFDVPNRRGLHIGGPAGVH